MRATKKRIEALRDRAQSAARELGILLDDQRFGIELGSSSVGISNKLHIVQFTDNNQWHKCLQPFPRQIHYGFTLGDFAERLECVAYALEGAARAKHGGEP